MMYSLIVACVLVAIAVSYQMLKLPKQNVNSLRKLLILDNGEPRIFGHRAGQHEGPENTIVAIETAAQNGATAIEIDLEFSEDGIPVIFHDDDVDRVTDGHGPVSSYLYADLAKLNAAAHFEYTLTKEGKAPQSFEKIPTLAEAVGVAKKHNLVIDLDVKSDGAKTCGALKSILHDFPDAADFIFVTSFYPDIVYAVGKHCPQFHTGLIWRHSYTSRTIAGVPRYAWYITPFLDALDKLSEVLVHSVMTDFLGVPLVAMHKDHLSKRYVDAWRAKGVEVMAWTVNDPVEKDFLLKKLGIPIVTDSLLNLKDVAEQTN